MSICKKCAGVNAIFGILFLVAGLGLWAGAPAWFNGWTIIGLYVFLWGLSSFAMPH